MCILTASRKAYRAFPVLLQIYGLLTWLYCQINPAGSRLQLSEGILLWAPLQPHWLGHKLTVNPEAFNNEPMPSADSSICLLLWLVWKPLGQIMVNTMTSISTAKLKSSCSDVDGCKFNFKPWMWSSINGAEQRWWNPCFSSLSIPLSDGIFSFP